MKHQVILQKMVLIFAEIESAREEDITKDARTVLATMNKEFKRVLEKWAGKRRYRIEYPSSRLG